MVVVLSPRRHFLFKVFKTRRLLGQLVPVAACNWNSCQLYNDTSHARSIQYEEHSACRANIVCVPEERAHDKTWYLQVVQTIPVAAAPQHRDVYPIQLRHTTRTISSPQHRHVYDSII